MLRSISSCVDSERLSTSIGAGSVRVGAASKHAMSCCAMALMERTVERSVLTQSIPTISSLSRIKYVADSNVLPPAPRPS